MRAASSISCFSHDGDVSGYAVHAAREGTSEEASTRTDENGEFALEGLTAGSWQVRVSKVVLIRDDDGGAHVSRRESSVLVGVADGTTAHVELGG